MKVALFSTNDNFFGPVAVELKKRGHEVRAWKETASFTNGYNIARLMQWADLAFVEFVQTPFAEVLAAKKDFPNVKLVARLHRIEMYGDHVENEKTDWTLVDTLFVSAHHVAERFLQKRDKKSKPKEVIVAPTNIADPKLFPFVERKWQPPFRICMVGNFVPKKRQYTAIQMFWDVQQATNGQFIFDIVGQRGSWSGYGNPEYYQNCLDLIEELKLKDSVQIYDKIAHSEMGSFLAREHVLISNSNEEGTHVSVAEAAVTGCIPMVNCWRGAKGVYPENTAWHFRSPCEFVNLCKNLTSNNCVGMHEMSKTLAAEAAKKYGRMEVYTRMVENIERLLENK